MLFVSIVLYASHDYVLLCRMICWKLTWWTPSWCMGMSTLETHLALLLHRSPNDAIGCCLGHYTTIWVRWDLLSMTCTHTASCELYEHWSRNKLKMLRFYSLWLRLRTSEAVPLLFLHAFLAWTESTLPDACILNSYFYIKQECFRVSDNSISLFIHKIPTIIRFFILSWDKAILFTACGSLCPVLLALCHSILHFPILFTCNLWPLTFLFNTGSKS